MADADTHTHAHTHGDDNPTRALFDFITHTARLREVQRHNHATPERPESVAEHSWHLAMVCWILHSEFERENGLRLDLTRMLKLCLMHDVVEIDTGDPSAWQLNGDDVNGDGGNGDDDDAAEQAAAAEQARADKARTEDAVAHQRFGALPAPLGPELLALWREYEEGVTPESRLVRGVDRLNPALMRLLTGQGWSDVGADAAALNRLQLPRVSVSPTLSAPYEEVRDAAIARGLLRP
jgi:putative hydrolase of HD superfamily